MKIELYVVKPYKDITYLNYEEKEAIDKLESLKVKLCELFGGLTESATAKGYWLNDGKLVKDDVTVWTIVSATEGNRILYDAIAEQLKDICKQKSQLYTIDNKPFFV